MVSTRKVVFLFLLAALLLLSFTPVGAGDEGLNFDYGEEPMEYHAEEMHFFRGKVLSVEDVASVHPFATLDQEAEVLFTSGPFKGDKVWIESTYIEDDPYLNVYLQEGSEIILTATMDNGALKEAYLHDVVRDRGLYYLLALFAFLLLLVGRMQGLKTIITLIFTGVVIIKVILPLLLAGYEPIPVATLSATVIIIFTLLVIGGVNAKSFAAIVGTVCGVTVAGILALWVGNISYLTGFSTEEAQMLQFMEQAINIRGLLFAGIIIGSLGAVTDVGMSVASAAAEIKVVDPRINSLQLMRAALNVGRDIMGTMSNTLVLAYAGGAMPLLLLLVGYEMEWLKIINLDLIATEVVRGVAGSIGLIISIPVTAVVAGILMGRKR